jgi:glycosyltransferase involved in cell wall biosynthesis
MIGTISIIIPTKDRRDLLRQALESVAAQRRPCAEAIVIDAGSDGSDVVAREYPFVKYVRQRSRGLTAARNEALRLASGDYVAMLDSDDLYEPDFLLACGDLLDREVDLAVAYTRGRVIDAEGRTAGMILQGHRCPAEPLRALARDNFVVASFALVRRSVLAVVGGYDESLSWADDYDLFLRIALQGGRFAHVPRVLAARRRHSGSLTAAFPAQNLEAIRGILERHSPALGAALREERAVWLARVDYRVGRALLEGGDVASARELLDRALAAGCRDARLYRWWCDGYHWLNPALLCLRQMKRFFRQGLGQLGLVENRWS